MSTTLYVVLPVFLLIALIAFGVIHDFTIFRLGPLNLSFVEFMAGWALLMAALSSRGGSHGGGRRR